MAGTRFEDFYERLRMEADIGSQTELADALGVGRAAVSSAKRKGTVPARWVLVLAERFNLSSGWLATGMGDPCGSDSCREDDFVRVPKVVARLCAGGGSFETGGEVEGFYSFRSDWIHSKGRPDSMVLMEVFGNSMEPEIREGDMVLIDQSRHNVLAGGIYAVGVEDTVMVKRIEKRPGSLVLLSDNTDYSPIELAGEELNTVRVIGKILWVSREYR